MAKTLTSPGSGSFEDMLVGCLWHNNYLVTVSLGGTISIFSATDLDESPVILSGHMKNVNSVVVLKKQNLILSCSYDGLIVKWTKGVGYAGKLDRKVTDKIKCFAAVDEELVTSGYDNKVIHFQIRCKSMLNLFLNSRSCSLKIKYDKVAFC